MAPFAGQILAVLERRDSLGRTRHLTIDEQIASGKRRSTENQLHKSRTEIVADFMRRSFKRSKAPSVVSETKRTTQRVEANENAASASLVSDQIVISNENAASESPDTKQVSFIRKLIADLGFIQVDLGGEGLSTTT